MKKIKMFKKITAFAVASMMCLASVINASAQTTPATIDETIPCSLTMYKYDLTKATADGVWSEESSYVATGYEDENLAAIKDYAIEGVEFTILPVADIVQFTNGSTVNIVYGFEKENTILEIIGLEDGTKRYVAADTLDANKWYFDSNVLNKALYENISNNEINTKNALEELVTNSNSKTVMPLTDVNGKTQVSNLEIGLYMVIETKVPEDVVDTTNPFFLSLPMTEPQGEKWNYDVIAYPKNETGDPTLEKSVRESIQATGKTEEFTQYATGSMSDLMEYQIISTLPTITSSAVYLTKYDFVDTISGLEYKEDYPMIIEFYTDKALNDKVANWDLASGKFAVEYNNNEMKISMTESGIEEINKNYSKHTMVITYGANITNEAVLGEIGNPNTVTLKWERTSTGYFDTLTDDAIVYSFGIDLTKMFSNIDSITATNENLFNEVKFEIFNKTDGVYLIAELQNGIYVVNGYTTNKEEATKFVPQTVGEEYGKVIVKGVENDVYELTEISTADTYTLLKDKIAVEVAFTEETGAKAYVNGKESTMLNDGQSVNAYAALSVINNKSFDLPTTGDSSLWIILTASALLAGGALIILSISKKKNVKE